MSSKKILKHKKYFNSEKSKLDTNKNKNLIFFYLSNS